MNSGSTFFFSLQDIPAVWPSKRTLDWKEALDSSLGSFSDKLHTFIGSVSSVCNVERFRVNELNVGPMWYQGNSE